MVMQQRPLDFDILPVPQVIEEISEQEMLNRLVDNTQTASPSWEARETDHAYIILENTSAYAVLLRAFLNNQLGQGFIRYAVGSNLDNIAALMNLTREVGETDESLRTRVLVEPRAQVVVGTADAIRYHVGESQANILDSAISVQSNRDVHVYFLMGGNPPTAPTSSQRTTTQTYINAAGRKSVIDTYVVQAPTITTVYVSATIHHFARYTEAETTTSVNAALDAFREENFRLGQSIRESRLIQTLNALREVDFVEIGRFSKTASGGTARSVSLDPTATPANSEALLIQATPTITYMETV